MQGFRRVDGGTAAGAAASGGHLPLRKNRGFRARCGVHSADFARKVACRSELLSANPSHFLKGLSAVIGAGKAIGRGAEG